MVAAEEPLRRCWSKRVFQETCRKNPKTFAQQPLGTDSEYECLTWPYRTFCSVQFFVFFGFGLVVTQASFCSKLWRFHLVWHRSSIRCVQPVAEKKQCDCDPAADTGSTCLKLTALYRLHTSGQWHIAFLTCAMKLSLWAGLQKVVGAMKMCLRNIKWQESLGCVMSDVCVCASLVLRCTAQHSIAFFGTNVANVFNVFLYFWCLNVDHGVS